MTNQEEWKDYYAHHKDKDSLVAALKESNEMLGGMLSRYRRITAYLRKENSRLRKLKNIQVANDAEFRAVCREDIYTDMT